MAAGPAPGLVRVALPLPMDRVFTYSAPDGVPPAGTRVLVPFRAGSRIGWSLGADPGAPPKGVRPIQAAVETEPSASPEILALCRWVADYYIAPLGIAIRAAMPSVLSDHSRDFVQPTGLVVERSLTANQQAVLDALMAAGGPRQIKSLAKDVGVRSIWGPVRELEALGLLRHTVVPPGRPSIIRRNVAYLVRWIETLEERDALHRRAPRQAEAYLALERAGGKALQTALTAEGVAPSALKALAKKGIVEVRREEVERDPFAHDAPLVDARPPLTSAQESALGALTAAAGASTSVPFLLHGVTGSGKTRVYVEALAAVMEAGKGGIVLVPEISLTPQTVHRFRSRFGDAVAVLHSGLSDGERYDQWRALAAGRKRIAVGARSAVFAPVHDLGLIVVDEEHDGSYKQSDAPRYNARDLAVVRARMEGAVCVLGSATPSLESWVNAQAGKYTLLELPDRVGESRLPPVHIVDLKKGRSSGSGQEADRGRGDNTTVLGEELLAAVDERLARGEQTILLLNRRGYSSFLSCPDCGDVPYCPDCAVSLTYHRGRRTLMCHHCRHTEPVPGRCPRCGSAGMSNRGLGTEQVEHVVATAFPGARIARMDVDTTSGKWAHREILERVEKGEVDILLGTQMIAKGLDFERVTLVGVVNADVGLHLPDFRASERTFQLLSQVAGRAGRGALGGEVILQTAMPAHYILKTASHHDYHGFAEQELAERKATVYPPYTRLTNVVFSSPDQGHAAAAAEQAERWMRTRIRVEPFRSIRITGPAPSPIERLHGRWRWHLMVSCGSARLLGQFLRLFLQERKGTKGDVRTILDRDPTAVL